MNNHFLLVFGLFFLEFVNSLDFTYSPADLYRLVEREKELSNILDEIGQTLDDFNYIVDEFNIKLIDYGEDEIIKNPLLSYKLVKRHAKELDDFDLLFDEFLGRVSEMGASYKKMRSSLNPTSKDVDLGMEAIIRLRQTYDLSVKELAEGKIKKFQLNGSLTPEDLADIGFYAIGTEMKVNAKLFLTEALNKSEDFEASWREKAETELENLNKQSINKIDREDFRVLTEINQIFATDSIENLNSGFEDLCQMHAVKEAPISSLKCYLNFNARLLSPLKLEVYHLDPQVLVIYDFISDSEIAAIDSASFYNLKRSVIQYVEVDGSLKQEASIIRTTSQTWIYDLGHPQFGYLSKRIEAFTGYYMSGVNSAEELQVASYRPGGHYSLHTDGVHEEILKDHLEPIEFFKGDRQATFMLYLSDVEMGGNTVFPMLNVSVKPVKGSAILWGNLHPDGLIARYTLHGACPVIYGIKNIATKWIRANDQMFTRHRCKADKSSAHFNL